MQDCELLEKLRLDGVDRTPLYLLVYRRLRELIVSGAFAPGEKLMSEAKLAEAMKVGRTSLRTALVLLQEDGYVSIRHGSGTFVTHRLPRPEDAAPAACLTVRDRLERLGLPLKVEPGPVRPGQTDAFLDEQLEADGQSLIMAVSYPHLETMGKINQLGTLTETLELCLVADRRVPQFLDLFGVDGCLTLELLRHQHGVARAVNGDKALRIVGADSVLGIHTLVHLARLPYWMITLI